MQDTYNDKDKDDVDNQAERLYPTSPSFRPAYTSIEIKLAIERAVDNKKDHNTAQLDANAYHIGMLSKFRCICVVRGEHSSASSLDDEAHDIHYNEDFCEPLGGDAGHAALRNGKMDKAGDDHIYERVNP